MPSQASSYGGLDQLPQKKPIFCLLRSVPPVPRSDSYRMVSHAWAAMYWRPLALVSPSETSEGLPEKTPKSFAVCTICAKVLAYGDGNQRSNAWAHTTKVHPEMHPSNVRPAFTGESLPFLLGHFSS